MWASTPHWLGSSSVSRQVHRDWLRQFFPSCSLACSRPPLVWMERQWMTVLIRVLCPLLAVCVCRTRTLGRRSCSWPTITQRPNWAAAWSTTSSTVWAEPTEDWTSSGLWPPADTTTSSSPSHNQWTYQGQCEPHGILEIETHGYCMYTSFCCKGLQSGPNVWLTGGTCDTQRWVGMCLINVFFHNRLIRSTG